MANAPALRVPCSWSAGGGIWGMGGVAAIAFRAGEGAVGAVVVIVGAGMVDEEEVVGLGR